jgi:hypothetical protein
MILQKGTSIIGNNIRLTAQQWAHIIEAHDYMAGNLDKVMETVAEPTQVFRGQFGESLALRPYQSTNITRKTAVVAYRDEPDGFIITAFFTSRPERIQRNRVLLWPKSSSQEN